jgi:hypothetical protein
LLNNHFGYFRSLPRNAPPESIQDSCSAYMASFPPLPPKSHAHTQLLQLLRIPCWGIGDLVPSSLTLPQ